ncbi:MAG: hypothetical protein B193_1981 [Solidesulfovibrio magneticus str. Maddingley MBC34]|uniref:Uncharacterized protein n=1 Tax=Solidesulfovibrio magneticus str. Maddingley MBC34 TaxID=1206767 RepID=K6GDY7_9BACT|nr:MAG: hypothetical protein B193_1981 [Solidesulfovibrio magneticus str. Maddingley MBC34]
MGRIILPGEAACRDQVVRIAANGGISTERLDPDAASKRLLRRGVYPSLAAVRLAVLFSSHLCFTVVFTLAAAGLLYSSRLEHAPDFTMALGRLLRDSEIVLLAGYLVSPATMLLCLLFSGIDLGRLQALGIFESIAFISLFGASWQAAGAFQIFAPAIALWIWTGLYGYIASTRWQRRRRG